ncbi:MAG: DNA polymerase III subunit gamma/tau [Streptococcaceae bacterium]|jgi:DNA polymerase-3 subunit gamma/tau|nr:DNA polymerase III subunit gamma/tau [Streptococcaceae bacterium]
MVYQALYRKYRSQTFDSMIGQEVVTTTLKNAIMNDQISHAYLFSGPRGTGKTSAAKIFAKAINCPNQKNGEPCNACDICRAITRGTLEDVIELDAASNNGVDEIREIRDKSTYAATVAKYKVYIIDEVHMLSTGAFNALLKTLEEPTPGVVFILATTELQKIPATIISRVQRFAFKAISTADIRGHLAEILNDESIQYEDKALEIIAKSAEGGMRDALSLLDQALSFSDGLLKEKDALLVTGAISDEALLAYVEALSHSDSKAALTQLDKVFAEGKNMLRFAEDLLSHFRDLLFDEKSEISHDKLYRWIDIAIDSMKLIKETTQTKIAADVMTMKLAENFVAPQVQIEQSQAAHTVKRENSSAPKKPAEAHFYQEPLPEPPGVEPVGNFIPEVTKAKPRKAAKPAQAVPINRESIFKALDEAVEEPDTIQQVRTVWNDVIESLGSPRDMALLKVSKLTAGSSKHLLLTVEQDNLAKLITSNAALLDMIGNSLSQNCGFRPEIIVISEVKWREIRAEYAAQHKNGSPVSESTQNETEAETKTETETEGVQLAQQLFGDKVVEIDD